ncbi:MAG: hypothetical protein H8E33_01850 [Candidatus Cloacimonetes bacterium]|nr:hypothetical protein [Candidatus Cloacimonadota bacterium]
MKKVFILIISFFLMQSIFAFDERNISVEYLGKEIIEIKENRRVRASFRISNNKYKKIKFSSTTKLPEGWKLLTGDQEFDIVARGVGVKIVSFYIPWETAPGKYEITYLVEAERYKYLQVGDFQTFHIEVLPVTNLEIKLKETPDFVISGGDYQATFLVTNDSNAENDIIFKVDSSNDLPFLLDIEEMKLQPGESANVTVRVQTDKKIKKVFKHRLLFSAKVRDDEHSEVSQYCSADIIPRISSVADHWRRIPTFFSVKSITRQYGFDEPKYYLLTSIIGQGNLDSKGNHHISYKYFGYDYLNEPITKEKDTYYLKYSTTNLKLKICDFSWRISELLGYYSGRGLEAQYSFNKFKFGGSYQQSKWFENVDRYRAFVDYRLNNRFLFGARVLAKNEENIYNDKLLSLSSEIEPFVGSSFGFEYATQQTSEINHALFANTKGKYKWLSYSLDYVHSPPDFNGNSQYFNQNYFSADLKLPLSTNTEFNSMLHYRKRNLDLDSTLTTAPLEKRINSSIDYNFQNKSKLSFGYSINEYKDLFENPDFNFIEKYIRLYLGQNFKDVDFAVSLEVGKKTDYTKVERSQNSQFARYDFSINYEPNDAISFDAYFLYDKDNFFEEMSVWKWDYETYWDSLSNGFITDSTYVFDYDEQIGIQDEDLLIGLSGKFELADKTFFSVSYKKRFRYDIFELQWEHSLPNMSRFSITGRYSPYIENQDIMTLMAEYSIPLGVPINKKKTVGMVKGLVYEKATKTPIPNAIININGLSSVSNSKGIFLFKSVKPGDYDINVKTSEIRPNLMTLTDRNIRVYGGKKTWVDLGITEAASVTGNVVVYDFKNGNHQINGDQTDEIVKSYGIAGIVLEMINEDGTTKRTISNGNGRYEFHDLLDGVWTLKLYDYNLPEYHYFENETFDFKLKSGQKKEIEIKILPKKRKIKIIEDGGIIIEESD